MVLVSSGCKLMQIHPAIRKCVVYLGYEVAVGSTIVRHVGGTGFIVGLPVPGVPNVGAMFIVTAKHVIEDIAKADRNRHVFVRANRPHAGTTWTPTPPDAWIKHGDPCVDLAILGFDISGTDALAYPVDSFASSDVIHKEAIGPGDEVFMTGLFVGHPGQDRNIPILRAGNIAAMPEEDVSMKYGLSDAYLIESRSTGGLSGSPVFVYVGKQRTLGGAFIVERGRQSFYLLGLVHGHWDAETDSDIKVDAATEEEGVNMGIAMIVPAQRIVEILSAPQIKGELERYATAYAASRHKPTPDANPPMFST
jgi:hypothetical protein